MLRIRLARTGRKKLAHYRVVVSESDRTPTGGAAVQLGHYNPHTKELNVDTEKLQQYLDQGAQPSGRIVKLLQDRDDVTVPGHAEQNLVMKEEKKAPEPEKQPAAEQQESEDEQTGSEVSEGEEAAPEEPETEADTEEVDAADEAQQNTEAETTDAAEDQAEKTS